MSYAFNANVFTFYGYIESVKWKISDYTTNNIVKCYSCLVSTLSCNEYLQYIDCVKLFCVMFSRLLPLLIHISVKLFCAYQLYFNTLFSEIVLPILETNILYIYYLQSFLWMFVCQIGNLALLQFGALTATLIRSTGRLATSAFSCFTSWSMALLYSFAQSLPACNT